LKLETDFIGMENSLEYYTWIQENSSWKSIYGIFRGELSSLNENREIIIYRKPKTKTETLNLKMVIGCLVLITISLIIFIYIKFLKRSKQRYDQIENIDDENTIELSNKMSSSSN